MMECVHFDSRGIEHSMEASIFLLACFQIGLTAPISSGGVYRWVIMPLQVVGRVRIAEGFGHEITAHSGKLGIWQ